jgi:hypothetical protein
MMPNSPGNAALLGGAGAIWRACASRLPAHRRGPRGVHFWRKGNVGPIVRERPLMTQSGHGSYRRQFTHCYCDLPIPILTTAMARLITGYRFTASLPERSLWAKSGHSFLDLGRAEPGRAYRRQHQDGQAGSSGHRHRARIR